ncbi:MAG TPA: hypothetical protein VFB50_04575 [Chloroflexota bacterium]|nr:hypothetical protein [Chloroflexota bacterium]
MASPSATNQPACGTVSAAWNVPNGGIAFNRSDGPVKSVIDAIGEYRTHGIISNGTTNYVSHCTMHSPGQTGWPTYCSTPAEPGDLDPGFPGASQVNMGAIYSMLFCSSAGSTDCTSYAGSSSTVGTNLEFFAYQNGSVTPGYPNDAANIANWLWNAPYYEWWTSQKNSIQGFWRLRKQYDNMLIPYELHQFMAIESSYLNGYSYHDGMHSESFPAYAQYAWAHTSAMVSASGANYAVSPFTLDNGSTSTAANALYNSVYNECSNSLGFWAGVGAGITCIDFNGICDEAADQVVNCMATGNCGTSDHGVWTGLVNGGATATSISPDSLGGWSGHTWSGYPTSGASVWGYDINQTPQWNSGGSVYGCFF